MALLLAREPRPAFGGKSGPLLRAAHRNLLSGEIIGGKARAGPFLVGHPCALPSSLGERPAMRSKYVMDALRRDVSFVWHTVISVVFIAFAGLAVAAALLDLVSISR